MLNYLKENDLVLYSQEQPSSWEEAIRISCHKLEDGGYATKEYADSIISSVEEHGPYIVLLPGVVMPHAPVTSKGVAGTAISLTVFREDVFFPDSETGEDKNGKLFFTIVAKDSDQHLDNIANLMSVLQDDEILQALLETESIEDYDKLLQSA